MDEENDLISFLRRRGVQAANIQSIEEDKIDCIALLQMDDNAMKNYIPAYGDRLGAVAFCRMQDRNGLNEKPPSSLIGRLQRKFANRNRTRKSDEKDHPSTSSSGNQNATKKDRRVELGWMDYDHATGELKQVRSQNGGGVRHLRVDKNQGFRELLQFSTSMFFPNGKSKKGRLVDFELSMQDFRGCQIEQQTVSDLYEETKVKMLRLYLCTKKKSEDSPSPDSDEDVHFGQVTHSNTPSQLDDTLPCGSHTIDEISEEPIVLDSNSDTELDAELPEVIIWHQDSENISEENPLSMPEQQRTQPQASNWPGPSSALQTIQPSSYTDSMLNIRLCRVNIQKEMIAFFKTPEIIHTPLNVTFVNEAGLDAKGVSREAYSAFWVSFFNTSAEGEDYRVPSLNPQFGLEEWQAVGRILSKGFCDHQVFPLQMAPAFFQALMFGEETVSAEDLRDSFLMYLSEIDRAAVKSALEQGDLSDDDKDAFEDILDREGCKTIPSIDQVPHVVMQLAHKCIIQNSNYAMESMRRVTQDTLRNSFPDACSIKSMYSKLKPTPKKVCDLLSADPQTKEQSQALRFLKQFIRAQDGEGLAKLLRFLTASSIMSVSTIVVEFKDVTGLARRPVAHTCGPVLDLPSTYTSYRDFRSEWESVLSSGYLKMDTL